MGLLRTGLAPRLCHSEERGEWRHTQSHKQNTAHLEGWWRQRGDGQQLIVRSWMDSCCGTLQTSGCHYTACLRHPRLPAGLNYNSKIDHSSQCSWQQPHVIQAVWEFFTTTACGNLCVLICEESSSSLIKPLYARFKVFFLRIRVNPQNVWWKQTCRIQMESMQHGKR